MAPRPISIVCSARFSSSPLEIANGIADLSRWSEFEGWGPLPGIESAEWERRNEEMVGSRIRVRNRDGSQHVEEILEWEPEQRVGIRLGDFGPPLRGMATHFLEVWTFESGDAGTEVWRRMSIHPASKLARIPLLLIAMMMKRALARHLRQMSEGPKPTSRTA